MTAIDVAMNNWFRNHVPESEGWDIFEASGSANNTPFQLQKVDELDVFPDDDAAWRHVVREASHGSDLHVAALAFLAHESIQEFVYIVSYLWREGL